MGIRREDREELEQVDRVLAEEGIPPSCDEPEDPGTRPDACAYCGASPAYQYGLCWACYEPHLNDGRIR